jgi:hypothetical protein
MDWEPAFIAVGVVLGEPLERVKASLASPLPPSAERLLSRLADPSREARAQALARPLSEVAMAIEAARLT